MIIALLWGPLGGGTTNPLTRGGGDRATFLIFSGAFRIRTSHNSRGTLKKHVQHRRMPGKQTRASGSTLNACQLATIGEVHTVNVDDGAASDFGVTSVQNKRCPRGHMSL